MVHTYDDALKASIDYFNGDDLAARVFCDKYALRNNNDELLELTPTEMHWRLAGEFARIEKKKYAGKTTEALKADEIFPYFDKFHKIIPQGGPMYGIGNNYQTISLSNCYFLEMPVDSYGGICKVDEQLVQISKRRGGVGIRLDNIRPRGEATHNSSRTTTGIVPFMKRYSHSIREVGQAGRRGALILTLSVHHPQILDFIAAKNNKNEVTGANISVYLTDEFLEAVEKDEEYEQKWPVESNSPVISNMVNAREVWQTIIKNVRNSSEPGLLFEDNIHRESPADCYERYRSVGCNACSEINLSVLDACRLLVLNTFSYVKNPFTRNAEFNFEQFYQDSQIAQRLMDDLVDLEHEKITSILKKIKKDPEPDCVKDREKALWETILKNNDEGRRTGTGVTGIGDTIAALNYKYGSPKSIEVIDNIYRTLKLGCYRSSVDMAKELGTFVGYDSNAEKNSPFIKRLKEDDEQLWKDMKKCGRRNVALTTTPPAGSVSLVTQTTSGIEPLFKEKYTRRKKGNPGDKDFRTDFVDDDGDSWMEFEVVHPKLQMYKEITGKEFEDSPYVNARAEEISWTSRVKLQAAAQKHICHSIASTINLPEKVTEEEVQTIYEEAWKQGLKGITIYRQGSRSGVLVEKKSAIERNDAPKRPQELSCDVHHTMVGGKPYFILIGLLHGCVYECFAGKNGFIGKNVNKGKIIKTKRPKGYKAILENGVEIAPLAIASTDEQEIITRLVSTSLRHGAKIKFIVEQLHKVEGDLYSFAKGIGRILKKYIEDGELCKEKCPECKGALIHAEGCIKCKSCGWSKC